MSVYVRPGAKRSEVSGKHGDELRVLLEAPPVDGKANEALVRFLARLAGVPRAAVLLEHGGRSRHKIIAFNGLSARELEEKLKQAETGEHA